MVEGQFASHEGLQLTCMIDFFPRKSPELPTCCEFIVITFQNFVRKSNATPETGFFFADMIFRSQKDVVEDKFYSNHITTGKLCDTISKGPRRKGDPCVNKPATLSSNHRTVE